MVGIYLLKIELNDVYNIKFYVYIIHPYLLATNIIYFQIFCYRLCTVI